MNVTMHERWLYFVMLIQFPLTLWKASYFLYLCDNILALESVWFSRIASIAYTMCSTNRFDLFLLSLCVFVIVLYSITFHSAVNANYISLLYIFSLVLRKLIFIIFIYKVHMNTKPGPFIRINFIVFILIVI